MTQDRAGRGKIFDTVLDTIGNTPLVRLNALPAKAGCSAHILAKLEFFNPLSSVKDRTAFGLVSAAEEEGTLRAGGVIVECTSGNTGIGLALMAAVRGYRLILTMPDNMSIERRKLLAHLGAEIVLTPAQDGMAGALAKAEELASSITGAVTLRQFSNPANPAIHERTTAQEIWNDTAGEIDAFVAGVGTGGTVQGVGATLKALHPALGVYAVEPAQSAVLSGGTAAVHGIQGIGAGFVPDLLDRALIDEVLTVGDDEALEVARALAREEGLLAGISSGAAVAAALRLGMRPAMAGKTIVVILPDSAERYLSTPLFQSLDKESAR